MVSVLKSMNYQFQEFLLSPEQFGIPNVRLRYFCLVRREPSAYYFRQNVERFLQYHNKLWNLFQTVTSLKMQFQSMIHERFTSDFGLAAHRNQMDIFSELIILRKKPNTISQYLESDVNLYDQRLQQWMSKFMKPTEYGYTQSIVNPSSCTSACFTKVSKPFC